jgi:hypothetical protein
MLTGDINLRIRMIAKRAILAEARMKDEGGRGREA